MSQRSSLEYDAAPLLASCTLEDLGEEGAWLLGPSLWKGLTTGHQVASLQVGADSRFLRPAHRPATPICYSQGFLEDFELHEATSLLEPSMPIFKRKGNAKRPYQIRILNPNYPESGDRFIWGGTFATKKEAERHHRELLHGLDHGTFIEPSETTLGEYLPQWLSGSMKANVRTREWYRRLLKRYVLSDPIAVTPLVKLTTLALETLYAKLGERLSPRSVRMVHGVLRSALKKAERDRLILRNPTTEAVLPEQVQHEMQALDQVQLSRLLATSEVTGNRWHALWHLLANGGLRPSEALRLTWAEVGTSFVIVRGQTKTKGSRRTVKLPESTMTALAWHRTQQEAEKIAAGSVYRNEGQVFASQTGGPLDLKNVTARHFKPLLNAYYPLPNIRVYDLRHTHASQLLAVGTPVNVVSKRLGHASAKMTLDVYAHLLSGQDDDAVTRLEAYMAAGRS